MTIEVATKGKIVLSVVTALYVYYTLWVLVTPFIDEDQPIRKLFPDVYYALAIPVYAGVLLFSATLLTLGFLLLRDELRRKPKAA